MDCSLSLFLSLTLSHSLSSQQARVSIGGSGGGRTRDVGFARGPSSAAGFRGASFLTGRVNRRPAAPHSSLPVRARPLAATATEIGLRNQFNNTQPDPPPFHFRSAFLRCTGGQATYSGLRGTRQVSVKTFAFAHLQNTRGGAHNNIGLVCDRI